MHLGKVLKIKDNVRLENLEKYGFKHETMFGQEFYNYYINASVILTIIVKSREMYIDIEDTGIYEVDIPAVLFDMINAGLIEVVEV